MTKHNPFDVYQRYIALKTHFQSETFDCLKQHPKNTTIDAFEERPDKIWFLKLARHRDPLRLILANLLVNPDVWPEFLAGHPEAEEHYRDWVARTNGLTYQFKEDLTRLNPIFDDNLIIPKDETHPRLLKLVVGNYIGIETGTIIMDITNIYPLWTKELNGDILWKSWKLRLKKYEPFIQHYERTKFRRLIVDFFRKAAMELL